MRYRHAIAYLAVTLFSLIVAGPSAVVAQPPAAGCKVDVDKLADPETISIGDEVRLDLSVTADCSGAQLPAHVALVFDNSTYMGGQRMNDMRLAVAAFVDEIDFSVSRVGLASFSGRVEFLSALTDDAEAIKAASQQFFPEKGSDLTRALTAGKLMLQRGRDSASDDDYLEAVILFVGSPNDASNSELVALADDLRDAGTLVVTVAATSNAELEILESVATAPTFFHVETMSTRYPRLMAEIAGSLTSVQPVGADVVDVIPGNMEYVWGSGVPVPRIDGRELRWRYDVWPPDGINITYALEPQELGCFATNVSAEVELRFDRGDSQQFTFPIPTVCVTEPPTETPVPPTPVATPTFTPRPHPIYLPLAWRDHCWPAVSRADVVIVVDTSTSMLSGAADGRPRAEWVQTAASRLVDALDLQPDRASVVAVSDRSSVLQALTADRGALQTELARMFATMAERSVLAPAIFDATTLLSSRAPGETNAPVVLLITDGFDDAEAAEVAAAAARAQGIHFFALSFGPDADSGALERITGGADRHLHSPDGADLPTAGPSLVQRLHCGLVRAP